MIKLKVPADIYDEALAFCNARRAEKGFPPITELPAGYPQDARSCPCANSVEDELIVCTTDWWWSKGQCAPTEGSPERFIRFFDNNTGYKTLTLPIRDDSNA